MRRDVPLYEFMPYGAPELLEARRPFMSRALVVTCAAVLILCALAGGLAPWFAVAPVETREIEVEPVIFEVLPDLSESEPMPRARPETGSPETPEHAQPVPVSDEVAPPGEMPVDEVVTPGDGGTGTDVAITPGEGGTGPATETLPALGEWRYREVEPAAIKVVKPEYPRLAWEAGVEGQVMVHVLVGREGRVLEAVLAEKIQVPMLNAAALAAARQWVFSPGMANGRPVPCWTAIPFNFRLH